MPVLSHDAYSLDPAALPRAGDLPPDAERLADTLGDRALPFVQWTRGFRVGTDTLALARHAVAVGRRRRVPPRSFVELCAGTGLIACTLGLAFPEAIGWAVEIEPVPAALTALNLEAAGVSRRVRGVRSDLGRWREDPLPIRPMPRPDLIAVNPPWYVPGRGPEVPDDPVRARARSETTLPLETWVAVAARLLAPRGRLALIYPSGRIAELFSALERHGLKPLELIPRVTAPGRPAGRCLVTAAHGRSCGDLVIRPSDDGPTEV